MKLFSSFLLFFVLSFFSVKAANPGANYGCLVWNNALYTNYWKDDTYSNWGGNYHYYDDASGFYSIIYGSTQCGQINPNNSFHGIGQNCFVSINGVITQGGLGTFDTGEVTLCETENVPLDSNIIYLTIVVVAYSLHSFHKNGFRFY